MRFDGLVLRQLVAAVLLALGATSLVLVRDLGVDNRLERWVAGDSSDEASYEEFRRLFGSDEFIVVALSGKPLFEAESLDVMVRALEMLERVPGIAAVEGLPSVFRDVFGGEDPEAVEEEFTSTPFYRNLMVSRDGSTAGLLLEVEPSQTPESRSMIVDDVHRALASVEDAGFEVRTVGSPVLAAALDEISRREARRTFPIAFAASMVILGWLLRSFRLVVIAATSASLSVVLTLAVMVVADRPLSMVSAVLPSLLYVLALSNCVHILLSHQRRASSADRDTAIRDALAETTRPCTLAAATTALGFASLVAATMSPVREVGLFAALGIAISLAVNLTVVPSMLSWLSIRPRSRSLDLRWMPSPPARPSQVLIAAAVLTAMALAVVPRVPVESNPLSFLPKSSPTTDDYRVVGEQLTGFFSMEIVVSTPDDWWAPDVLAVLDELGARLTTSPIVAKVLSPPDLLRKARQWQLGFDAEGFSLPEGRAEAERIVSGLGKDGGRRMARFAVEDGRTVRVSAVVNEMDEGRFLDLVSDARSAVADLPDGYEGWITGLVLRLVEAQKNLVSSQIRSLGFACLVVFAAIAVGLGSWRLTVISVFPNMVPVLAVFAMMAVFRIPLDAATVMVASIALGIAVDNTVHLLSAFQREAGAGETRRVAAVNALRTVGTALVVTTATACVGFFSLGVSAFVPIRDFGLLAGGAMLVALVADLLVVPSMLVVGEER